MPYAPYVRKRARERAQRLESMSILLTPIVVLVGGALLGLLVWLLVILPLS